jgi:hypothetical protein
MNITNNWTIVIGVATVISTALYWTNKAYLDSILEMRRDIIERVRRDMTERLQNFHELISVEGEERFADEIYNIAKFKKFLREARREFNRQMLPRSLTIIVLSVLIVSFYETVDSDYILIMIIVGILLFIQMIFSIHRLLNLEDFLSRYLEGEDPSEILFNE